MSRVRRRAELAAVLVLSTVSAACGSDSPPAGAGSAQSAPASQGGPVSQSAPGPQAAPGMQAAPSTQAAPGTSGVAAAASPAASTPVAPTAPVAGPSRAQADAMGVAELVQRRDLWPARVSLVKELRLDPTTWWRAGDELPLSDWDGANVYLDEGSFVFDAPAEFTDVEARARNVAAALSAEALALNVAELIRRPELWPQRLAITSRLGFADNTVIPPGREVTLRFFEGQQLCVYDREVQNYYTVAPNETDVMARARERLALPEDQRAPFFLRSLEAALEPRADGGAVSLAQADYVLVFAGRLGCTRCSAFAPQVKEFYSRAQAGAPQGSRFELVLLCHDPNADSARKYAAELGLPGGVIAFDRRLEAANLMALPLQMLPGLFVFDRAGTLVARNDANAGRPSADEVLAQFAARIEAPTPR